MFRPPPRYRHWPQNERGCFRQKLLFSQQLEIALCVHIQNAADMDSFCGPAPFAG
jgi:hypothetical protein